MHAATPEDVLAFAELDDCSITPDGSLIAFTRRDNFKEYKKPVRRQIWVIPADHGAARPFSDGTHAAYSPLWSPDGRTLAFLSDRTGETQIYLLPRDGGEAQQCTNVTGDISAFEWSPDGSQIALLLAESPPPEQAERAQRGDDVIEFEQHPYPTHVWVITVADRSLRQVTTGASHVWEFGWAADGGFALVVGDTAFDWSWFSAHIAYVGPTGGEPQMVYRVAEKCFARPRVTPDGQIAFLSGIWSDRGMNAGDLFVVPANGGEPRNLSPGYNGSIWWYEFSPDGATIDFLAYEQSEAAIGRIDVASATLTTRWHDKVAISESFTSRYIAANGTIALVRSSASTPQEVWLARSTAEGLQWQQLSFLQTGRAAELALGEQRTFHWHAADGQPIQGLLILPIGYQHGQRVPLITWVHGGPAWLFTHDFFVANRGLQMLAGVGYAVFLPNPRGSNGFGVAFLEQNIGDFGGADYSDIISGIDALIDAGIADPARLGIGGWSYGGFMAAWAIGQTQRFKAAVVGAAIINWRSFHGTAAIGRWDEVSLRANPYEVGNSYDTRSPLTYVAHVTTPVLLQHGQHDTIVPVQQSYEFYRALKDRGVPVDFAMYPRASHSISERLHLLDRMRRWLEWFQQRV